MPNFSNNALTDSGRVLLSHINMGAVFTPTRIVLGSGDLPAGKTPRTMTEVVEPVKSLDITKKQRTNDGKMIVGGYYSNSDITSDWEYREIALYAKAVYYNEDGSVSQEIDEVCYSYGNAGDEADTMYAYTSGQPVERQMDLCVYVGNDATVNMIVESGVYIPYSQKGSADGVATLGSDGKVPSSQLPAMSAENTTYDNADSGLTAENVQAAIDELQEKKATLDKDGKVQSDQLPKISSITSVLVILTTSGWTEGTDGRYYQTVAVEGVKPDTPVVFPDCALYGTDLDADAAVLDEWEKGPSVNNVDQGEGTLTFHCYDLPSINIPVNVGVIS